MQSLVFAAEVNAGDVVVVEHGRGAAFLLEAVHALRVACSFGRQNLQRDDAPESGVACFQHRGHAAGADGFDEFVVSQLAAGDRRRFACHRHCQGAGRRGGGARFVGDDGGRVVGVGGAALRVCEELSNVGFGRRLTLRRTAPLTNEVGERVILDVGAGRPGGRRERNRARRCRVRLARGPLVRRRDRRGGFRRGRLSGRIGRRNHFGSHSAAGVARKIPVVPPFGEMGRRTAPALGSQRLFLPGRQRASGPRARIANGVVTQL